MTFADGRRKEKDVVMDKSSMARKYASMFVVALWTLCLAGPPRTHAANLVVNGGFDADSPPLQIVAGWIWTSAAPAGWTLVPADNGTSSFFVSPMPLLGAHSDPNAANF